MIKRVVCISLLLIALLTSSTTDAAGKPGLTFDGNTLSCTYTPIYSDGIQMVPVKVLNVLLNIDIISDNSTYKIYSHNDIVDFCIKLGDTLGTINGEDVNMSTPPVYSHGLVYAPIDFMEMTAPGIITWDAPASSASIVLTGPDVQPAGNSAKKVPVIINLSKNDYNIRGSLMLVNKSTPLPQGYMPENLKSVVGGNGKLLISSKSYSSKLRDMALDASSRMFRDAISKKVDGLVLSSGYRSYNTQSYLFLHQVSSFSKSFVMKVALEKAGTIVAPPGKSEHQTGLAMDVTTKSLLKTSDPLSASFAKTPQGKWLTENCWKYGFVVRYAREKSNITGIIYEPWHFRYVGQPHSEIMTGKKMCLEEYLEYIRKESHINYTNKAGKEYDIYYFNVPSWLNTFTLLPDKIKKYDITRYGKSGFIVTIER